MARSCLTALSRHRNAYFTGAFAGLFLEDRGDDLGHAVSRRVGIFCQVTVGFPGEVPVDGVFEGVEVLNGDDGGHGLAVARDDGRRTVLGPRDDLGEVRAGIPDTQLGVAVVHTP